MRSWMIAVMARGTERMEASPEERLSEAFLAAWWIMLSAKRIVLSMPRAGAA